jgi:protein phosphatase
VIIQGNWEDDFWGARHEPIVAWHLERLGMARVAYMDSLPFCYDFMLSGRRVRLLHGSAEKTSGYIRQEDSLAAKASIFCNTDLTGSDNPEPTIVGYGHIHKAYQQSVGKRHFLFNTGSVGNPTDDPTASYVILKGVFDSAEFAPFSIEHVRVPYDIEYAIQLAREAGLPDLAQYEFELRTARYRGEMDRA